MTRARSDRLVPTRRAQPLVAAALAAVLSVAGVSPARAYLKFGVDQDSRAVALRWARMPVRYFVSDTSVQGVPAAEFRNAVARAFETWQAVPTASIRFEFVGFTSASPLDEDGASTLGFLDEPGMDRVLGATSLLISRSTGEIVEADIFFNSAFPWSVAPAGEAGRFDVESIAVHEIGHFLGLAHSALGESEPRPDGGRRVIAAESVMFPIAFLAGTIDDRTLKADDRAGVSDLYPEDDFRESTGTLTGRIRKNGRGVAGAHLAVFHPETGTLIGGFSVNDQGGFSIAGLPPGLHVVRVEPLDDADVESFFESSLGVDVDFAVTFPARLPAVPAGGTTAMGDIEVRD
jgi:hypothetical protein